MIKPHQQLVKNLKFLSCLFALLFALVGLSTATPNTHAAGTAPPLPSPTNSQSRNWSGYEAIGSLGTFLRTQCTFKVPTLRSRFSIITDGASAECILEVPLDAISGTLAHLPSFGSAQISGYDAGVGGNGRWTSIAGLPNLSKIKMFKTVQANNSSRQTNGQQQVFLTDVGKLSCLPYLDCFTVFESNSVSSQVQQSRNSVIQRFIR